MGGGSSSSSSSSSESESESEHDHEPIVFKRAAPSGPEPGNAKSRRLESLAMADLEASQRVTAVIEGVDDTDGLDDQLEFQLWQKREIARIQREYEELRALDERAQRASERANERSANKPAGEDP